MRGTIAGIWLLTVLASLPMARVWGFHGAAALQAEVSPKTIACDEEALRQAVRQGGEIMLPHSCVFILSEDLPVIETDVAIVGQAAVIDGRGQYRVFYSEDADVTLDNLTVRRAASDQNGGAVFVRQGDVTVSNSVFEANVSTGTGGALMVEAGNLTITDTVFKANTAVIGGGAVAIGAGNLTVTRSTFDDNTSTGCGAGIIVYQAAATIAHSALINNTVVIHGGGALCLVSADVEAEVVNSTFSHNQAGRGGGGIAVNEALITITNCTITLNQAGRGGGIWANGTVNLQHSIVFGNTAELDPEISMSLEGTSLFNSWGFNLLGEQNNLTLAVTDLVSRSPQLEPLVDGVHLLLVDSPGLDAIPPERCMTETDQRGVVRPQKLGCDIGAIEMDEAIE